MNTDKNNNEIDELLAELAKLESEGSQASISGGQFRNLERDIKLISCYDKILDLKPEKTEVEIEIEFRKLNFYSSRGRNNEANRFVDQLIQKYPTNVELLALKVEICFDLIDKTYTCGPFFEKPYPDRIKYYKEALVTVEKWLELDQNYIFENGSEGGINCWYWKGLCLDTLDKFSEALESYSKAHEFYKKSGITDSSTISLMGDLFFKMEKYVEALEKYQMAITVEEPGNHYFQRDILPKMGYCYLMIGEYRNALYAFEDYEKLSDDKMGSTNPQRKRKEFLKEKSIALFKEYKINDAFTSLEEYFELFPDDPQAYFIMSVLLQKINDNNRALENLDNALEIDRNFADAWLEKSKIHHNLANYEEEKISSDHFLLIHDTDDKAKCNHYWWNLLYNCLKE